MFAPPGKCQCSSDPGSLIESTRYGEAGENLGRNQWDRNECFVDSGITSSTCTGIVATNCECTDNGYCGHSQGGRCGIKPHTYAGDVWIVREGDIRKDHILFQRFVIYDAALGSADELMDKKLYKTITLGEPKPDEVLFKPPESLGELHTPVEAPVELVTSKP